LPQAVGLTAELKAKFGEATQVELVEGRGGVFEVEVDGNLVFSKKQTRRFPAYQEVPNAITMAGLAG
jgi:selT/selW/selH-like putative selenoprotein